MGAINPFLLTTRANIKSFYKVICLVRKGCNNRPFFHISVLENPKRKKEHVLEQLGNYDPFPNKFNEKIVSIDFKKLEYWLQQGAHPSNAVIRLLGLCGYFPIHPSLFQEAWTNRLKIKNRLENLREKVKQLEATDNTDFSSKANISVDNSSKT